MSQTTNTLLLIRPVRFQYNKETADTNAFQNPDKLNEFAQDSALDEFNRMVKTLRENGVGAMVFDDTTEPHTPDSVFPNNWFSTHEEGSVVLYPMYAQNRRQERRHDIFDTLTQYFSLTDIIDLTYLEKEDKYLEGTGSMVLDRDARICYACLSPRTNKEVLQLWCNKLGYELNAFHAVDEKGNEIYHTNVMMCIGEHFLLYCDEAVKHDYERELIVQSTSKEIITISLKQMNAFAGNMLEVKNDKGESLLLMSDSAYDSLKPEQITRLEKYCRILHFNISTIEQHGGGSVRCMLAEIFLPKQ